MLVPTVLQLYKSHYQVDACHCQENSKAIHTFFTKLPQVHWLGAVCTMCSTGHSCLPPLQLCRAVGKAVISALLMHHHSSSPALGLNVVSHAVPGWHAVLWQRKWPLMGLDIQKHVAGWGAASPPLHHVCFILVPSPDSKGSILWRSRVI